MMQPGGRVAVVTPSLGLAGGTEVYMDRLFRAQASLGLSVRVYTAKKSLDTASREGLDERPRADLFADPTPRSDSALARAARETADEIAGWASWVELHHHAPLALARALEGRSKVLLFQHTARLTCPALGRYLPVSGSVCDRPAGVRCWPVELREGCLSRALGAAPSASRLWATVTHASDGRAFVAAATRVVFNSQALLALFERTTCPVGAKGAVLWPPLAKSTNSIPNKAPRGRDLVFLGRLIDAKGVTDAVRAAALVPASRLHVYGAGSAEAEARSLAVELGVDARFHGWVDSATAASALSRAGCLLVPTRMFEAWGMVGPEAIAAGCPVVAYDSGGIREWLAPEYGEIVPHGDPSALAAAARRQLSRHEAGLDTSDWPAAAEERWGLPAFTARYARLAAGFIQETA